MVEIFLLVFSIACVGIVAFRRHQDSVLTAYKVVAVVSLWLPYFFHMPRAWDEVSGFAYMSPDGPLVGVYPGLIAFALFTISLLVGLVILIAILARHFALLLIPLTPIVAGFFYWIVALKLLQWQVPGGFVFLDDVPLVWLFGSTVFSTVFMSLCGWIVVLSGRSNCSR